MSCEYSLLKLARNFSGNVIFSLVAPKILVAILSLLSEFFCLTEIKIDCCVEEQTWFRN
jgi:hypothetical protein